MTSRVLPPATSPEDFRRRLFLLTASSIGFPTLVFFALLNIQRNVPQMSLVCAVGAVLMAVNAVFLSRPYSTGWVPRAVLLYVCAMIILNLVLDATTRALFWPLLLPVIALFVFGTREGIIWTALFPLPVTAAIIYARAHNPTAFNGLWFDLSFAYVDLSVIAYGYETLRRRAQSQAEDREHRLQRFVDTSSDWLFELDRDLRLSYVSPRWEQITGIPVADVIGASIVEQAPAYFADNVDNILEPLHNRRPFREFRYSFDGANGRRIFVSTRGDPYFDDSGEFMGYTGTGTDLTAYAESQASIKEKEHQLIQSQKMESIGQLTSGIAHDFNNLLTVIIGYVDLLKSSKEHNPVMLDALEQAADKASQLTRRLLSFSRHQIATPQRVEVVALLRSLTALLGRVLGERVELHLHTGERELSIVADPSQFESAILNLAINARDAMDGHGNLTIDMATSSLRDGSTAGDYVLVRVTDDGQGMSPDVLDRVTEPFFSTKPQGEGTGLGLAMVNGFVTQCNGFMEIHSKPGGGTSVGLYFPAARASVSQEPPKPTDRRVDDERVVLVVEDNEDVAGIVIAMLESGGHPHHLVETGEDALEAIDKVRPDLVVSDVVLRGRMTGIDLAKQIRGQWPDIAIVLMSGYPDVLDDTPRGFDILRKPFTRAELLTSLDHAASGEAH